MKKIYSLSFFITFILSLYLINACTESYPPESSLPQVKMKTDLGDIIIEIDTIITSHNEPQSPAAYGALPKVLGHFSREKRLFSPLDCFPPIKALKTSCKRFRQLSKNTLMLPILFWEQHIRIF